MLPVASGEGSLVAMPEAPPARAHRVNAQAPTRSATTFSALRITPRPRRRPPASPSLHDRRPVIVGDLVEQDPLGERHDMGRSGIRVHGQDAGDDHHRVATSCHRLSGRVEQHRRGAILGSPGGRPHHVVGQHQPWSQRCLDGHVAVWLCRIGGVAAVTKRTATC